MSNACRRAPDLPIAQKLQGQFLSRDDVENRSVDPASPPFNKKLKSTSISLDVLPSWIIDKNFDLDYHVRYSALPTPGSMDQLMKLVERLHSRQLDRTRPLWECYYIEGLAGNRVALYFKMHHSCVDGVAAMSILGRVLSTSKTSKKVIDFWQVPPANAAEKREAPKLMDHLLGSYTGLMGQARSMGQLSTTMLKSGLQAVARDLNVTVNDIVPAICSGAIRRYLKDHGNLPPKPILAMCPVSVRPKDAEQSGNQISMIVTTLATDESDMIARLNRVHDSASEAKENLGELTREAATNYVLLMNDALLLANATGLGDKIAPPANLVISNVPGPRERLYLIGAELIHNYPMSVLVHGQALNITVTSYADELDFGLLAAREAMPDLNKLADYIGTACDELEIADEAHLSGQAELARQSLMERRTVRSRANDHDGANVNTKPQLRPMSNGHDKGAVLKTAKAPHKKARAEQAKPRVAH